MYVYDNLTKIAFEDQGSFLRRKYIQKICSKFAGENEYGKY